MSKIRKGNKLFFSYLIFEPKTLIDLIFKVWICSFPMLNRIQKTFGFTDLIVSINETITNLEHIMPMAKSER